jgi:hypothetical protein
MLRPTYEQLKVCCHAFRKGGVSLESGFPIRSALR